MKKECNDNTNLSITQLEEPMIFYNEEGVPLIPGMVFYDCPVDFKKPIPPLPPLDVEYFQRIAPVIKDERDNNLGVAISVLTSKNNKPLEASLSSGMDVKVKQDKNGDYYGEEYHSSQYAFAQEFLRKNRIRIVNEIIFIYNGRSYSEISLVDLKRELLDCLREKISRFSNNFVDAVANYILKEKSICFRQCDVSKEYVSYNNCLLDIRTGQSCPHSSDAFTTYEISANYCFHPIQTPQFDNFLWGITGGDVVLIERILQSIGYILTPDVSAKKFFLLQGVQDSGKSVLVNIIQSLFNEEAVTALDISDYGQRFSLSSLIGKALCSSPDMQAKELDLTSVSKIKQLTGNDVTTTDVKYGKREKFVCSAKLILATNHPFRTTVKDDAFFSRCVTIPFYHSVPDENKDRNLQQKILSERNGIVSKAFAAYRRLVANNYVFAGNYMVNDIFSKEAADNENYQTLIYKFANHYFEQNADGFVFSDDAHKLYTQIYGHAPLNDFSYHFYAFVKEKFAAQKVRKHKKGHPNAQSCFYGISLKEGVQ